MGKHLENLTFEQWLAYVFDHPVEEHKNAWYWDPDAEEWDIIPIHGKPNDPARKELDQVILHVMESTLQLDSIACRESALHGLGHWQHEYPEQVGEIINRFSMSHRNLRKELETYMMNAFTGYVL